MRYFRVSSTRRSEEAAYALSLHLTNSVKSVLPYRVTGDDFRATPEQGPVP